MTDDYHERERAEYRKTVLDGRRDEIEELSSAASLARLRPGERIARRFEIERLKAELAELEAEE